MADNNPLPRCLYCGGEMYEAGNSTYRWYMCPRCLSGSPRKIINKTEYPTERLAVIAALQKARKAAMQRWQEPNRVLTLKEATEQRAVWIEDVYCGIAPAIVFDYVSKHYSIIVADFNDHDDNKVWFKKTQYGKHWRCWLRKPTNKEMATTPWREK